MFGLSNQPKDTIITNTTTSKINHLRTARRGQKREREDSIPQPVAYPTSSSSRTFEAEKLASCPFTVNLQKGQINQSKLITEHRAVFLNITKAEAKNLLENGYAVLWQNNSNPNQIVFEILTENGHMYSKTFQMNDSGEFNELEINGQVDINKSPKSLNETIKYIQKHFKVQLKLPERPVKDHYAIFKHITDINKANDLIFGMRKAFIIGQGINNELVFHCRDEYGSMDIHFYEPKGKGYVRTNINNASIYTLDELIANYKKKYILVGEGLRSSIKTDNPDMNNIEELLSDMTKEQAEIFLSQEANRGKFLIRVGSQPNSFTLSWSEDETVKHTRIKPLTEEQRNERGIADYHSRYEYIDMHLVKDMCFTLSQIIEGVKTQFNLSEFTTVKLASSPVVVDEMEQSYPGMFSEEVLSDDEDEMSSEEATTGSTETQENESSEELQKTDTDTDLIKKTLLDTLQYKNPKYENRDLVIANIDRVQAESCLKNNPGYFLVRQGRASIDIPDTYIVVSRNIEGEIKHSRYKEINYNNYVPCDLSSEFRDLDLKYSLSQILKLTQKLSHCDFLDSSDVNAIVNS